MDGSEKEINEGSSAFDLAKSISNRLAKEAIVGEVNGTLVDLSISLKIMMRCKIF